MRIDKSIKLHGNMNRIIEMDAEGVGANAIAGIFQDFGMDINANDVRSALKFNAQLTKKVLPKKAAKNLIKQHNLGGFEIPQV